MKTIIAVLFFVLFSITFVNAQDSIYYDSLSSSAYEHNIPRSSFTLDYLPDDFIECGMSRGLDISGNFCYVTDQSGGRLFVIDITLLDDLEIEAIYDGSGSPYPLVNPAGIDVDGNYAYICDGYNGFFSIDIKNPSTPFYGDRYYNGHQMRGVEVRGNYAYIATRNTLDIIDITDPLTLNLVGSISFSGLAKDITVSEKYAFIAVGTSGIRVFNVKDRTAPFYVTTITYTSDLAWDVEIKGNKLYVADYYRGMAVIDITDPEVPIVEGFCTDISGNAYGLTIVGDWAYVVTKLRPSESGFLNIIDITNSISYEEVDYFVSLNHGGFRVKPHGNWLLIADSYLGVLSIKVEEKIDLTEVASITLPRYSPPPPWPEYYQLKELKIHGNYIYVQGGQHVVDITNPTIPTLAYSDPSKKFISAEPWGDLLLVNRGERSWSYRQIWDISIPISPCILRTYWDDYTIIGELVWENDYSYLSGTAFDLPYPYWWVFASLDYYYTGVPTPHWDLDCVIDLDPDACVALRQLIGSIEIDGNFAYGSCHECPTHWFAPFILYTEKSERVGSALTLDGFYQPLFRANIQNPSSIPSALAFGPISSAEAYPHNERAQAVISLSGDLLYAIDADCPHSSWLGGLTVYSVKDIPLELYHDASWTRQPQPSFLNLYGDDLYCSMHTLHGGDPKGISYCDITGTRTYPGIPTASPEVEWEYPNPIIDGKVDGDYLYVLTLNDPMDGLDKLRVLKVNKQILEAYYAKKTYTETQSSLSGNQSLIVSPNPFCTKVNFTLKNQNGQVEYIKVFNILGQEIKQINSCSNNNIPDLKWDGTDNNGREVESGVYFCNIRLKNDCFSTKVILIRE